MTIFSPSHFATTAVASELPIMLGGGLAHVEELIDADDQQELPRTEAHQCRCNDDKRCAWMPAIPLLVTMRRSSIVLPPLGRAGCCTPAQ